MKLLSLLFLSTLISLAFSNSANAQISTSDMLSRIDNDKITFQRDPLASVPSQVRDLELARLHAQYPKFKDSMWYMASVKENGYINNLFYDWSGDVCLYIVFNENALKAKKPIAKFVETKGAQGNSELAKKEIVPMKYCEKIYNFYSTKKE